MRDQILEMLKGLSSIKPEQTANYQVRLRIRDAMLAKNLPAALAYDLAGMMTVEVADELLADKELIDTAVESLSTLAVKMYHSFVADFSVDAFRAQFSQVSLKLNF